MTAHRTWGLGWIPRLVIASGFAVFLFGAIKEVYTDRSEYSDDALWDYYAICMHPPPPPIEREQVSEECFRSLQDAMESKWTIQEVLISPVSHSAEESMEPASALSLIVLALSLACYFVSKAVSVDWKRVQDVFTTKKAGNSLGLYARVCIALAPFLTLWYVWSFIQQTAYPKAWSWPRKSITEQAQENCILDALELGSHRQTEACLPNNTYHGEMYYREMSTFEGLLYYMKEVGAFILPYAVICVYVFFAVRWIRRAKSAFIQSS